MPFVTDKSKFKKGLQYLKDVERLFLAVPRGFLQFVNVVFPDHTHLLFLPYSTKVQWDISDLPFVKNKDYQY